MNLTKIKILCIVLILVQAGLCEDFIGVLKRPEPAVGTPYKSNLLSNSRI